MKKIHHYWIDRAAWRASGRSLNQVKTTCGHTVYSFSTTGIGHEATGYISEVDCQDCLNHELLGIHELSETSL